jgi:hypothetical protein
VESRQATIPLPLPHSPLVAMSPGGSSHPEAVGVSVLSVWLDWDLV